MISWFYMAAFFALSFLVAFALGRFCRRGNGDVTLPPEHEQFPVGSLPVLTVEEIAERRRVTADAVERRLSEMGGE